MRSRRQLAIVGGCVLLASACQWILGDLSADNETTSADGGGSDASSLDAAVATDSSINDGGAAEDVGSLDAAPTGFCVGAAALYCTDFDDAASLAVDFQIFNTVSGATISLNADAAVSPPNSILFDMPARTPTPCESMGAERRFSSSASVIAVETELQVDNPNAEFALPRDSMIPITLRRDNCRILFRVGRPAANVAAERGDGTNQSIVASFQSINANLFKKVELVVDFGPEPTVSARLGGSVVIDPPKALPSFCALQTGELRLRLGNHCDPNPDAGMRLRFDNVLAREVGDGG